MAVGEQFGHRPGRAHPARPRGPSSIHSTSQTAQRYRSPQSPIWQCGSAWLLAANRWHCGVEPASKADDARRRAGKRSLAVVSWRAR
jgi:hypothetical protein